LYVEASPQAPPLVLLELVAVSVLGDGSVWEALLVAVLAAVVVFAPEAAGVRAVVLRGERSPWFESSSHPSPIISPPANRETSTISRAVSGLPFLPVLAGG
jgi:hypothetical protein